MGGLGKCIVCVTRQAVVIHIQKIPLCYQCLEIFWEAQHLMAEYLKNERNYDEKGYEN